MAYVASGVQPSRYHHRPRRVVVPLVLLDQAQDLSSGLTPKFRIEGKDVWLNPPGVVTVPRNTLGRCVASLADDISSSAIINAIDAMITRAYG